MSDDAADVVETETDSVETTEVDTGTDPVDETTDAPDAGTDPVEAQPADEPEEYRKLSEKFGGDKAKIAAEFWQAKTALSNAAKERQRYEAKIKELEGRTRQPEKPATPPPPPEIHPDIKKLDERITAYTNKAAEIEKSQRDTLVALNTASVERQVLERQLKASSEYLSPEAKAELKAELYAAQTREAALLEKFQGAEERKELNQERLDRAQQEKDFASKHLEGAKARQEQAERELAAFHEEFPNQIDEQIKDICDELKVSEDKSVREFVWSTAYAHLVNLLSPYHGQGIPADQVDFQAVLRQHVELTNKVFDVIGRSAIGKLSTAKRSVAKPVVPPVKAPPSNGTAAPVDWRDTPDMVARRERLAKLGL